MAKKSASSEPFIACVPVVLPSHQWETAAKLAIEENPRNAVSLEHLATAIGTALVGDVLTPERIAVMTSKYWGQGGVKLGVSFLDNPNTATRNKIIAHMNAWNQWANVQFQESSQGDVRIARQRGGGYWSYLGTDIRSIRPGSPTMNLEAFTENTPDSEYKRVVRHETGHTLGCPHEHMRRAIIALLDPQKTIAFFQNNYGWDAQTTTQQVLTPVEESSLMGTPSTDEDSIMCYQFSGACTKDGNPIPGGLDINEQDGTFIGKLYPKAITPPSPPSPPPPPVSGDGRIVNVGVSADTLVALLRGLNYTVTRNQ